MIDKKDDYINYIKKLVIEFQKTRELPLIEEDLNVILKLIELEIDREIKDRGNLRISVINLIRNALESSIELDSFSSSKIEELKSFKRMIKYRTVIKNSPILSKMIKNKKIDLDKINDNIPSINCTATDDCLLVSSLSKEQEKTIYEIRKGDQIPSICEEKLISNKELHTIDSVTR